MCLQDIAEYQHAYINNRFSHKYIHDIRYEKNSLKSKHHKQMFNFPEEPPSSYAVLVVSTHLPC